MQNPGSDGKYSSDVKTYPNLAPFGHLGFWYWLRSTPAPQYRAFGGLLNLYKVIPGSDKEKGFKKMFITI